MLFTDPFFLLYFLPIVLLTLRLVQGTGNSLTWIFRLGVIGLTLLFYAYENWTWAILFLCIAFSSYVFGFLQTLGPVWWRRVALFLGIFACLSYLCVFKYLNWFVTLLPYLAAYRNTIANLFGAESNNIQLPPGISFYTFEAVSFLIDIYRDVIVFPRNPLHFFTFITMFPRFIAGPIVRYKDVIGQILSWPGMRLLSGLNLFAVGFSMKILFADQAAKLVPYAYSVTHPDFIQSIIGVSGYTLQIYFDFWAYSIMATGLGLCLGFSFPDNFNLPYKAVSVSDFWRRWHLTLSYWLRDYLYFSLGGSRQGRFRKYVNLLITMTIGGLWHGASFTFLAWGFYHGALMVIERVIGEPRMERVPRWIRMGCTLVMIATGWVLFRATSFKQAVDVYAGLMGFHGFASQFSGTSLMKSGFPLVCIFVSVGFLVFGERRLIAKEGLTALPYINKPTVLIFSLFVLAFIMRLSEDTIPFLYFQF
jgi:alginate O-acetyltransferase complex protein AlgI